MTNMSYQSVEDACYGRLGRTVAKVRFAVARFVGTLSVVIHKQPCALHRQVALRIPWAGARPIEYHRDDELVLGSSWQLLIR